MRRFGITLSHATDQAQKDQQPELSEPFAALPTPPGAAPYRWDLNKVIGGDGPLVFHVIGDHGGVKDPNPQLVVAKAMVADCQDHGLSFCYSVGDVDYFTGEEAEIGPQFYEAYADYPVPIVAIPGNHDGAGADQLATFMATFCDPTPKLIPAQAEYQRDTMDQPNCYWTLTDEMVTIIGLYSNVPSGGVIEQDQQEWLEGELAAAPKGVPLIVALHHPPYSCDAHHGGSQKMGTLLDAAFVAAGRWPELVLAGHVHDYQRFTRTVHREHECTYVVCGAGGYHNLHKMAPGAVKGLQATPDTTLEAFDDSQFGFLRLTVAASEIAGEYIGVDKEGTVTANVDNFAVPIG